MMFQNYPGWIRNETMLQKLGKVSSSGSQTFLLTYNFQLNQEILNFNANFYLKTTVQISRFCFQSPISIAQSSMYIINVLVHSLGIPGFKYDINGTFLVQVVFRNLFMKIVFLFLSLIQLFVFF